MTATEQRIQAGWWACVGGLLTLTVASLPQPAAAARLNFYNQCLLVPYLVYDAAGAFSSVGVLTRAGGTVYWQFTGAQAISASGTFLAGGDTLTPFIWSLDDIGTDFIDQPGTLLLCIDRNNDGRIDSDDGDTLSGNAFLVNPAKADVAFLPTVHVDDSDLAKRDVEAILNATNRVRRLANNPVTNDFFDLPYLADGRAGGDDTEIIIWTSAAPDQPSQAMTVLSAAGESVEIETVLSNQTLHIINVDTLPTLDALLPGDGFLRWRLPEDSEGDTLTAFAFSLVRSERFGATQTLLGNY